MNNTNQQQAQYAQTDNNQQFGMTQAPQQPIVTSQPVQGYGNNQAYTTSNQPQQPIANNQPLQSYANNGPAVNNNQAPQAYVNNQPQQSLGDGQPAQGYANNQPPQAYTNNNQPPFMADQKMPFTNDIKQPGDQQQFNSGSGGGYSKNSVLPDYGANTSGITPAQKEQQLLQQQMQQAKTSGGYPGVVGGTPAEGRGVTGYDAQGNPIIPGFVAQRHQIEQSLGPTCKDGGYHDLRMLLTTSSLLFAVLIIPYCCGYRGKRVCTCKKCNQRFPNIVLPSA